MRIYFSEWLLTITCFQVLAWPSLCSQTWWHVCPSPLSGPSSSSSCSSPWVWAVRLVTGVASLCMCWFCVWVCVHECVVCVCVCVCGSKYVYTTVFLTIMYISAPSPSLLSFSYSYICMMNSRSLRNVLRLKHKLVDLSHIQTLNSQHICAYRLSLSLSLSLSLCLSHTHILSPSHNTHKHAYIGTHTHTQFLYYICCLFQFALLETVMTAVQDTFPHLRQKKTFVVLFVCLGGFLGGLIICTQVSRHGDKKVWY